VDNLRRRRSASVNVVHSGVWRPGEDQADGVDRAGAGGGVPQAIPRSSPC